PLMRQDAAAVMPLPLLFLVVQRLMVHRLLALMPSLRALDAATQFSITPPVPATMPAPLLEFATQFLMRLSLSAPIPGPLVDSLALQFRIVHETPVLIPVLVFDSAVQSERSEERRVGKRCVF